MMTILALAALSNVAAASPVAASPVAVVELFTSEGCSSCPPADLVLHELAKDPRVLALGFHVDYWDGLGWKDPLSSSAASARQRRYARVLARGDYTPQMIVNGAVEFVGSDELAAKNAVARSLSKPAAVDVKLARDGDLLIWTLDKAQPGLELVVAIVEDGVVHEVKRGENSGRTLHHDRAVRSLTSTTLANALSGTTALTMGKDVVRKRATAIAFVQDPSSLAVAGGAQLSLE